VSACSCLSLNVNSTHTNTHTFFLRTHIHTHTHTGRDWGSLEVNFMQTRFETEVYVRVGVEYVVDGAKSRQESKCVCVYVCINV
jgi:hypothetical protein